MMRPYPLCWPEGHSRTPEKDRRHSRFRKSLARARIELMEELERFGAKDVVLSSDIPQRQDGLFYRGAAEPDDPGIAIHFRFRGRPISMGCDSYVYAFENVSALRETIRAFRAIERHAASRMLERAMHGFAALPPGSSPPGEAVPQDPPWWEVLGVPSLGDDSPQVIANDDTHPLRAPLLQLVKSLYRTKIKEGDHTMQADPEYTGQLNRAHEAAKAALGASS